MYGEYTVGVVVLAAGRSERMAGRVNKVYHEVLGSPVLNYSISTFIGTGRVDEFVLVYNEKDEDLLENRVLSTVEVDVPLQTVPGGEKRQDSARAGLEYMDTDYVFVHDGARPYFSSQLAETLLEAAVEHRAAFPGVQPVDTIRENKEGFAGPTVERDKLVRVQTPQCFERDLVFRAIDKSVKQNEYYSDDAAAVMNYADLKPRVVRGERGNIKLTTEEDVKFIKLLLSS
ncbi:MAG: 2-C-methyl-D-erythritol 4-phosphate cytidylyltransferase [Candidatus Bipolaricaulota bacterium]